MSHRTLVLHRLCIEGKTEYFVSSFELENGERVDLASGSRPLNSGLKASSVIEKWTSEGYITRQKLRDEPGRQVLTFTIPSAADEFIAEFGGQTDEPPAPADRPKVDPKSVLGDKPLVTL